MVNCPHFYHRACKNKQINIPNDKGQNDFIQNFSRPLALCATIFLTQSPPLKPTVLSAKLEVLTTAHSRDLTQSNNFYKKKTRGTSRSLSSILLQVLRNCSIKFTYNEYINKYQCQLKKYLSSWLRKCGNCSSPSSACGNCTTQCQQGASSKLQQLRVSSNSSLCYTPFKSCLWIINNH